MKKRTLKVFVGWSESGVSTELIIAAIIQSAPAIVKYDQETATICAKDIMQFLSESAIQEEKKQKQIAGTVTVKP